MHYFICGLIFKGSRNRPDVLVLNKWCEWFKICLFVCLSVGPIISYWVSFESVSSIVNNSRLTCSFLVRSLEYKNNNARRAEKQPQWGHASIALSGSNCGVQSRDIFSSRMSIQALFDSNRSVHWSSTAHLDAWSTASQQFEQEKVLRHLKPRFLGVY